MRTSAVRLALVLAVLPGASATLAQSNPVSRPAVVRPAPAVQPEGFFKPTPDGDPSLTRERALPEPPQAAPAATPGSAVDPGLARAPDSNPASAVAAIEQARWVEEQADRSLREAERDRAAAAATPPPVAPGAYNGNTSERDR
jgi:hypothetical protein